MFTFTIRTRQQLVMTTVMWTLMCVTASYVICFPVAGVPKEPKYLITALLCPALMAPVGAWVLGSLTMRLHETTDRLQRALERDHLTGIYNRQFLVKLLNSIKHNEPAVILMADIDHFKTVNDTHGHLSGDAVIHSVAQVLESHCRVTDIVARFGGEEFVVVMRGATIESGLRAAERMLTAVRDAPVTIDGQTIHVTISVGVAPRYDEQDVSEVLKAADAALYRAKEQGRDQVQSSDDARLAKAELVGPAGFEPATKAL